MWRCPSCECVLFALADGRFWCDCVGCKRAYASTDGLPLHYFRSTQRGRRRAATPAEDPE